MSAEVVLHLLSLFPDAIVDHVNSGGQPLLHQVVNSGLRCPEILQPLLDAVDSLDGAAEVQRSEVSALLLLPLLLAISRSPPRLVITCSTPP